jgi:hypothetical protein
VAEVEKGAFLDIACVTTHNERPMRLRVKLCLALLVASAIAFAASCGNFSGSDNGGGAAGEDGGTDAAAIDGSVSTLEGGTPMQDGAITASDGSVADAAIDSAPNCDTYVCDDAGMPIPDAACPTDTPSIVYEHATACTMVGSFADCEYCYSTDSTAVTNDCSGFPTANVVRFSIFPLPRPGLLELDRCGNSPANYSLQLAGACSSLSTGASHKEGVVGFVTPGKSCGTKDLTEMTPTDSKYYALGDAQAPTGYGKTGAVYWALPPP